MKLYDSENVTRMVVKMKQDRPLLSVFDLETIHKDPQRLTFLLIREIYEALEEFQKIGTPEFSLEAVAGELNDVLVFLRSIIIAGNISVDLSHASVGVNGYGKHSYAFERLVEVAGDLPDPRAILEIEKRILSIFSHLPGLSLPAVAGFNLTMQKLDDHRPAVLYSNKHPETAKIITDRDVLLQLYYRIEQLLRYLRDHRADQAQHLQPWEWQYGAMFAALRDIDNPNSLDAVRRIHAHRQLEQAQQAEMRATFQKYARLDSSRVR